MIRFIICMLFCITGFIDAVSQESLFNIQLIKQIKGEFDLFEVDESGSIYLLTSGGQLKKFNANLDSLSVFNEVRRYGKLHTIHAQHTLRTYLYFKNFNVVLILDRLMQIVQRIDLRKLSLFQVNAVCPSYDNQLWIFDEQNSRIKKIRLDGSIAFESTDLRLVFAEKVSPVKMIEHQGHLYLLDAEQGIYVFDYYGGFKEKIDVSNIKEFQSLGNDILFNDAQEIWTKRTEKNSIHWRLVGLPSEMQQTFFSPTFFYALSKSGLSIYAYQLNK